VKTDKNRRQTRSSEQDLQPRDSSEQGLTKEKPDLSIGTVRTTSNMSGRSGRGRGGGRGYKGRGSKNRGHGANYGNSGSTTKKGLCATLGSHVFDYGHKAAADQMRTTWEKVVQMVGTDYGQDICNELQ